MSCVKSRDRECMKWLTGMTRRPSRNSKTSFRSAHVFLGLRRDRARKRIFMGCALIVGEVGDVGDCTLSFELEMLPDEADRRRDSSIVACRSTLA